jgi:hypothetical protein
MLTYIFMKSNAGGKVKLVMGKIKTHCIACVLRLIWESHTYCWETFSFYYCLLFSFYYLVWCFYFCLHFAVPKLCVAAFWNHSVIILILLSCFSKNKTKKRYTLCGLKLLLLLSFRSKVQCYRLIILQSALDFFFFPVCVWKKILQNGTLSSVNQNVTAIMKEHFRRKLLRCELFSLNLHF